MQPSTRLLFAAAFLTALPFAGQAYTAAGDRTFPATLILPQIAPTDELYVTPSSQPLQNGSVTNAVAVNYDKTITDRLGIDIGGGYSWLNQTGAPSFYGWQNVTGQLQYLAVLDANREFLLSVGVEREFGGTGAQGIGASPLGATTPMVYFGKGLGDAAPPYLRPLAILGVFGYSRSDGSPRPSQATAGTAIEYSIPYLESKVSALALPNVVRALTPIIEVSFTTPTGHTFGTTTTGLVAPGLTYAGAGYELGIEAMIPATRATGRGVGVIAQVHFSLDYFFPETIGRPLFGAE